MSGFKNSTLNKIIGQSILKDIISKVLICCEMMQNDCITHSKTLNNLEEDIRDYLFANYLNSDEIMEKVGLSEFRFFSEVPENYKSNKPKGRTDLQVINMNMFKYRKKYFTIECKRIDGSKRLNRYYIEKGIKRFVLPEPLYPSAFATNCMFGFVVKNIDIDANTQKIDKIQSNEYKDISVKGPFLHTDISDKHSYTYEAEYFVKDLPDLLLYHVFYDFSSLINSK
jgi:hypothetical protein